MVRALPVLATVALAVAIPGCGGGSSSLSARSPTAASQPGGPTSEVSSGAVRGKLVGENHAPKIKANWTYTVTVTDASGHPLSGMVVTQFTFGGQVVGRETPPTHKLTSGRLHDTMQFPPASLGQQIGVQAVVRTAAGSITLTWPVTPRK